MKQTVRLSDDYLYIIYDPLFESLTKTAKKIIRTYLSGYTCNLYSSIAVEDLIQIGFEGILSLEDGLPISVYTSRAKNRMLNYIRDIRAGYRDDRKILCLCRFADRLVNG